MFMTRPGIGVWQVEETEPAAEADQIGFGLVAVGEDLPAEGGERLVPRPFDDDVGNARGGGALDAADAGSRADDQADARVQLPGGDLVEQILQRRARAADEHREVERLRTA